MIDKSHIAEAAPTSQLSLAETMQIMDVATMLRHQRERAERELDVDLVRSQLREKLVDAARVSGEPLTDKEVDTAIDRYFANLHRFQEPAVGLSLYLARIYVRRKIWLAIAAVAVIAGLLIGWIALR